MEKLQQPFKTGVCLCVRACTCVYEYVSQLVFVCE